LFLKLYFRQLRARGDGEEEEEEEEEDDEEQNREADLLSAIARR
jgi:hypothetical protein